MQVSTTARHCELDPEVRWFVQQRFAKLERFARGIQEAHLTVTAEGYRHSAEITLKLRRGEMVSREVSTEPRTAIDRAVGRLEQRLRRLKERRVSRKRAARSANGKPGNGRPSPPGDDQGGTLEED